MEWGDDVDDIRDEFMANAREEADDASAAVGLLMLVLIGGCLVWGYMSLLWWLGA